MQEPQSWRELLGEFISDPQEKQRIAKELRIRPITLTRWVANESDPRPQNLRRLLNAFSSEQREQFLSLNDESFGEFTSTPIDDLPLQISAELYSQVFNLRATTTETQRFWSIATLILKSAIELFDTDNSGMSIMVVRCMTPDESGQIRSLRENIGVGTPPWVGDLEQKAMFLSAESLAGYAVTSCRPAVIQDVQDEHNLLPAQKVDFEISSAAHPILFANRVAGCLLVSSTQPNFFLPQARLTLLEKYANLIALAFEPEDFYPPEALQLRMMPPHAVQKSYFANYRTRVRDAIWEAMRLGKPISSIQAEEQVWRQLESELLQVATIDT